MLLVFYLLGFAVDWIVDALPEDIDNNIRINQPFESAESEQSEQLQTLVNALKPCANIESNVVVSLVDEPTVNAMALPGKHMIVYQGLLDAVESEIGLAFVLAHELAHFKHKDHLRGLGRGIVLGGLSALLTGSNSSLTQVLMPASQVGQSHYSQSRETAADEAALRTIHCHYGHVNGAIELFEHLLTQEKESSALPFGHYLTSHPETQKRIDRLVRLAKDL